MTVNQIWQFGTSTHKGPVKKVNEDHPFLNIAQDPKGGDLAIVAVADGMGGYQAGDLASQLAIDQIRLWWEKRKQKWLKQNPPLDKIAHELKNKLHEINKKLVNIRQIKGIKLGTTLSVLILRQGEYLLCHVGDSRIYQFTGSRTGFQNYFRYQQKADHVLGQETESLEEQAEIIQLTEDHSWVQSQVQEGRLTKEEARHHGKRNVLLQCLGIDDRIEPYYAVGNYQPNDIFLLCSDGFYSCFSDDDIAELLRDAEEESDDLQTVSQSLVRIANNSGKTKDNITTILLRNIYVRQQVDRPSRWRELLKGKHFPF